MRQEELDDVVVYLGLQGFAVESVTVEPAPRLGEPARRIKVVRVVNDSGWHICPDCGKRHQRGLFPVAHRHVVLTIPRLLRPPWTAPRLADNVAT